MSNAIDREGDFRAEIQEYGLQKKDSGSVGVRMRVKITAMWNIETNQWDNWEEYDYEAWGSTWIIKKDKTVNKSAVESLVNYCGWDGNPRSIVENSWVPTPCRVSIKAEEYNGNTEFRVNFINAFDSVPGANVGNVDLDGLKALEQQFGPALRAVVGNTKRNTAPPLPVNGKGGPKKPPAPPSSNGEKLETVPPERGPDDEIHF